MVRPCLRKSPIGPSPPLRLDRWLFFKTQSLPVGLIRKNKNVRLFVDPRVSANPHRLRSNAQVYRARLDPKAARTAGLMSDGEADWEIDDPRLEVAVKVGFWV